MKHEKLVDLSKNEDLSIATMNLISIEEHLSFTYMKTKKQEYLHVLDAVRNVRKRLLKILLENTEGEMWCISKHLLATTMRIMEVGTKYIEKEPEKAGKMMSDAFDMYSLFWLLQKVGGENARKSGKKAKKMEVKDKTNS